MVKKYQCYWSVILFKEKPSQAILDTFLSYAQPYSPLQTNINTNKKGILELRCRFSSFEQASELCDFWQSRTTNDVYIAALREGDLIDIWSKAEKRIQTKLKNKLGGKIEVSTLIGK